MTTNSRQVAAWITDPAELKVLLDLMLDTRRDEMLVVRSVLSYLDARFPMIAWVELETGSRARIALANPTDGEQIMRLQWLEGDPIPSASVVPSGQVVEVNVDRPDLAGQRPVPGPGFEPPTNDIVLSVGRMQERLRFAAERLVARPPGIQFGPFLLPMGLSDAWSGEEHYPPAAWGTAVILRKRSGSWELFFECRRPADGKAVPDLVEIHLGPPETPIRVIRVASDGTIGFSPEGARFQGATARVKVFEDRWRSIVRLDPVLVEAASAVGEPQTLQIGLRRLRDGQLFSVAGAAVPPWSSAPPIYLVDLSEWGEILPSAPSPTSSDDASVYSEP
jgi:hypothetical protein